ncbi:hypothetical protein SS50377_27840 [Spironucleus salmonicida]|uniref:Uncharacterized protein n=1 Tax=Spironucleus salmonicida TaxID=348837 RepID=V6LWA1_9EUKA|nr:hypothetical protein SS50377_27840 [Spironucleus salmonicida]|eukprot:EST48845.1 Hypothetical protein SS50377_10941 [Spironucleus salmonicida]
MKSAVFLASDTKSMYYSATIPPQNSLNETFQTAPPNSSFLFLGDADMLQKVQDFAQGFTASAVRPQYISCRLKSEMDNLDSQEVHYVQENFTRFTPDSFSLQIEKLHEIQDLKNQSQDSCFLQIYEILTFNNNKISRTFFIHAENGIDISTIINFIQSYYLFDSLEMENYFTFLKQNRVNFKSMKAYQNKSQNNYNPQNLLLNLINTTPFQIFVNEELQQFEKIATLRNFKIKSQQVMYFFDTLTAKHFEQLTFTHCELKDQKVTFQVKKERFQTLSLLESSNFYLTKINLSNIEGQIENQYIQELINRTNTVISQINERLVFSEFKLKENFEKYEAEINKQWTGKSNLSWNIKTENYFKIIEKQAEMSDRLQQQIFQEMVFKISEHYTIEDRVRQVLNACFSDKKNSHNDVIQKNKLDMMIRNYNNGIAQLPRLKEQQLQAKSDISYLKQKIQEIKIKIEDKNEQVYYNQDCNNAYIKNVVEIKNLINQYSSTIRNYSFEQYLPDSTKINHFRLIAWRNSINSLNKKVCSDKVDLQKDIARFQNTIKHQGANKFEKLKALATDMELISSKM